MARDESTIESLEARGRAAAAWDVPGLTVAGHPDPARVGDRAFLVDLRAPGGAVALSRQAPDFLTPGLDLHRPLALAHLSRKPVRLVRESADTLLVSVEGTATRVVVDGDPVRVATRVAVDDLDRGVVIELAGRVTLLLSLLARPRPTALDGLGMIGLSAGLEAARDAVRRVADTDVSVLVRGESGAGKELVARAIHQLSPRAARPFVAVNVASLAPTLVASQLFGHERGAFSGAERRHRGLFAQAEGGTLFLDEIGDAPSDVQLMLLRALETREIVPLGAERPVPFDVRVLAATDRDLEAATADGAFRAPLYHRLAGFVITLPPLRERREDIGPLLYAFLGAEHAALGEAGRLAGPGGGLPSQLVRRLLDYRWPGNVRELRNAARQIAIASRGLDHVALGDHLAGVLGDGAPRVTSESAPISESTPRTRDLDDDGLVAALRRHRFEIAPTAAALGIPRATLYDRIARSDVVRKASDLQRDEIDRAMEELAGDVEAVAARLEVGKRALVLRLRELDR